MAPHPVARRLAAAGLITGVTLGLWTVAHAAPPGAQTPTPIADTQSPEPVRIPVAPPRAVQPHQPNPCRRNPRAQLVIVSIAEQHEWACAHHDVAQSTPVTTGASNRGDGTPPGTFAVQGMIRDTTLDDSYRVKYWIPFHLGIWGFHDASWQHIPFGSSSYRTRGSHGCVHMPLAAIRWLFHWVRYGTTVRIT